MHGIVLLLLLLSSTHAQGGPPPCEDEEEGCADWAIAGECIKNEAFMAQNCRLSCKLCGRKKHKKKKKKLSLEEENDLLAREWDDAVRVGAIGMLEELKTEFGRCYLGMGSGGMAAVHTFTSQKFTRGVSWLLKECVVDPNFADDYGLTPLHFAAIQGSTELLELLVAAGAQLEVEDEMGRTALDAAEEKGHTAFAKALRAYQTLTGVETITEQIKKKGEQHLAEEKRMYDEL